MFNIIKYLSNQIKQKMSNIFFKLQFISYVLFVVYYAITFYSRPIIELIANYAVRLLLTRTPFIG